MLWYKSWMLNRMTSMDPCIVETHRDGVREVQGVCLQYSGQFETDCLDVSCECECFDPEWESLFWDVHFLAYL